MTRYKGCCYHCGKIVNTCNLHKSFDTHKNICFFCWTKENTIRKKEKLKVLRDDKGYSIDNVVKVKTSNRVSRLLKFGIDLIRGEREVLNK